MRKKTDMGYMLVCDRCGKDINGVVNSRAKLHLVRILDDKDNSSTKNDKAVHFELCVNCVNRVESFIKEKVKDKTS